MNCSEVRKYWCSKYQFKFGEVYRSDKIGIELSFLKKAIEKYGYYAVLEAIDMFTDSCSKKIASVIYLANPKYFETKYNFQNGLYKIVKYKRFLPHYEPELKEKVKELLEEYRICSHEMASDYDLIRKKEILKEVEEITKEYFEGM